MNKYVNIEDIEYGDVFSIADVYEIPASVTIEVNTFCNLYVVRRIIIPTYRKFTAD